MAEECSWELYRPSACTWSRPFTRRRALEQSRRGRLRVRTRCCSCIRGARAGWPAEVLRGGGLRARRADLRERRRAEGLRELPAREKAGHWAGASDVTLVGEAPAVAARERGGRRDSREALTSVVARPSL
jgi:hypothetical protein